MKKNRGNARGLPVPLPEESREYIEGLVAEKSDDEFYVQIHVPNDALANTPLAETSANCLFLLLSPDDPLKKIISQAGQLESILSKDELIAAVGRDDEAMLAEAEREVASLFREISARIGEDAARRIFVNVAPRPEGRPHKTEPYLIDRMLLYLLKRTRSRREAATRAHKAGLGQSIEANEKRLQRLMRSRPE